jgi:transposase-like protein
MFSPYERINAATSISAVCRADDGEYFRAGYDAAEVARRVGVDSGTLRDWSRVCGRGPRYAAIDVVRFETLARLVRSGVPVARAAVLLAVAEPTRDLSFSVRVEPSETVRPGTDWSCHDTTAETC